MTQAYRLFIDSFVKFCTIFLISEYFNLSTTYKYIINSYSISLCYFSIPLTGGATQFYCFLKNCLIILPVAWPSVSANLILVGWSLKNCPQPVIFLRQQPKDSLWASLVVQMVQNWPEMQETSVQSLGLEDPLWEGMATHSSIHAWRIPMDRGAWQATVHGVTRVGHD